MSELSSSYTAELAAAFARLWSRAISQWKGVAADKADKGQTNFEKRPRAPFKPVVPQISSVAHEEDADILEEKGRRLRPRRLVLESASPTRSEATSPCQAARSSR